MGLLIELNINPNRTLADIIMVTLYIAIPILWLMGMSKQIAEMVGLMSTTASQSNERAANIVQKYLP